MINISIKDVIKAIQGTDSASIKSSYINGICTDTRNIKHGDLFFALIGENSDGHNFITKESMKDCACAIVSKDIDTEIPYVKVDNTLFALGRFAKYYKSLFNVKTIGITGSVGKTSTKELLSLMLEELGPSLKNKGNFNNEIGVPLTIFELDKNHKTLVCEMGMRGSGQIDYLANIVKPDIGIITNIGMAHIELLGDQDNIADAKSELLTHLSKRTSLSVINRDCKYFDFMKSKSLCQILSFGEHESSDIRLVKTIYENEKIYFTIDTPFGKIEDLMISIPAKHYVINALSAIGTAKFLGVSDDFIRYTLSDFSNADGRFTLKKSCLGINVIDDTYNANPISMTEAIKTFTKIDAKRHIVILGDMLELGDYAKISHLEIGKEVVKSGVHQIFTVGTLAKEIGNGAISEGFNKDNIESFPDSETMKLNLSKLGFKSGDLILIKGSRSMRMEIISNALLEL